MLRQKIRYGCRILIRRWGSGANLLFIFQRHRVTVQLVSNALNIAHVIFMLLIKELVNGDYVWATRFDQQSCTEHIQYATGRMGRRTDGRVPVIH